MKTAPPVSMAVVLALGLYLLVTSAFYPLDFLSVFDAKRMLQLGMFSLLLLFAFAYPPLRKATITQLVHVPKFISYAILSLFVIGTVSSLRLPHPAYALIDVSMIFVMLLLVFVTAASRSLTGPRFDKWAVSFLAVMGFAVAFQELMGYLVGWVVNVEFSYDNALVHFASPRFYNQLQTWSIPVLAALPLLFPSARRIELLCITLLGLQWFLVFSTGARGTFVSLSAAMLVIAFWLPGQRRFWLKPQLSGVFVGIAFYLGIMLLNNFLIHQPDNISSRSGGFYSQSVGRPMMHASGRSILWRMSIKDAIKHPLLGAGPTRYACDNGSGIPAHPHSFPFRILGEWGFIALALLLSLMITIGVLFLVNLKHRYGGCQGDTHKDPPNDASIGAILAISAFAGTMHACLSGLLIMPASQVAMILIAGWALSLTINPRPAPIVHPMAGLALLTSLLLATTQLVFAAREIPHLPDRTGYSTEAVRHFPRFWWVGRACDYQYSNDNEEK